MKRGTIIWLNLEDTFPPEIGKTRPGIIISNSEQNFLLETVVAVPFSTQPPDAWPLRIEYGTLNRKPNFAVIPGIRQVKRTRLLEPIVMASDEFLAELDDALSAYLGD